MLSERIVLPANASRFFYDQQDAKEQPVGELQLGWDRADPYLRNLLFDPSLIAHDEAYCTSVVDLDRVVQVPTVTYFFDRVLPVCGSDPLVVDIGCGQGEFVDLVRARGVAAVGFDPVLRRRADFLHMEYFTPGRLLADVFVMRCVLPHIPDPWEFLAAIGQHHPGSLVLVEFQRLEWILEHGIWYQMSHDHVNLFSVDDFHRRFDVVEHGSFAVGEWAWVLLRADSFRTADPADCVVGDELGGLLSRRALSLTEACHQGDPVAVWGAAGKGIVLAHALQRHDVPVVAAIDADPRRHGLYMEVSGVAIGSPDSVLPALSPDTRILVANPNHLQPIAARYADRSFATLAGLPKMMGTRSGEFGR